MPERQTFNVLIGPDCVVEGKVVFRGHARVDGRILGEISSDGDLVVGESAAIVANIRGDAVFVSGEVRGDIEGAIRIELHTGARVYGDLKSPKVVIKDGVTFEGRCFMDFEPR